MKAVIFIAILFSITSCALMQDFEFSFIRNGQEFPSVGTAAAPFYIGDTLKIKLPKFPTRKCTAIIITGNHHIKKKCKGKKGTFLTIDLGAVNPRTLKTVGMSIARNGEETKSGNLYLGLANAGIEPIGIDYECPQQSQVDNQFTCMRPKDFKFIFSIYPDGEGVFQVSSSNCVEQKIKDRFTISYSAPLKPATGEYWQDLNIDVWKKYNGSKWILSRDFKPGNRVDYTIDPKNKAGYCPLRIDFKGEVKQSTTLHVDFYKI